MKLKKVISVLSVAVTVAGLALPALAQKPDTDKFQNPYIQAELEEQAARVETLETSLGTVTRYKENALPQVDQSTSKEWALHSLDVYNSRYVELDQVNTSNAKSLVPVWAAQTYISPTTYRLDNQASSTQPIVVDGIMYVTDYTGNIVALNAATGVRIWQFRVNIVATEDEVLNSWPTRGVTYADGVIYGVAGAAIFALNPKTGAPVTSFGNNGRIDPVLDILKTRYPDILKPIQKGFAFVIAPQYYVDRNGKGVLIIGTGLAEATPNPPGGLVIAMDAKTGQTLWSFNTIPQGPEDPYWDIAGPTWNGGGPRTGGCIWETPPIDPELGMVYVTLSNPMPFNAANNYGARRLGLNLFSDCTIALDLATGQMKWYFQQTHHDAWDWDSAQQPILFDATIGGKTIKACAMATKSGFMYMLDRATGKGLPGMPIFEMPVPTATTIPGEQLWPTQPFQFSAVTGRTMNNVPLIGIATTAAQVPVPRYTSPAFVTGQLNAPTGTRVEPAACSPQLGLLHFVANRYLNAWDMNTGELVWEVVLPAPGAGATGGLVATSGGVLFASDNTANAGKMYAFDAKTGQQLWSFNTGGGIKAPPVVYMLNGRQYVAIRSGVTIFTFALPN